MNFEVVDETINKYGVRCYVGGCVSRGENSSFRRRAHAHVSKLDEFKGWFCIRSKKRVYTRSSNKPSKLVWHEVAHLLVGETNWHNKTWNRKRLELLRENR